MVAKAERSRSNKSCFFNENDAILYKPVGLIMTK